MLQTSQDTRPAAAGHDARAQERIYAALDLGTNNCRLLIAAPQAGAGIKVFDSFSRVVRLGEGVSATGNLSEDAMERTLAALKTCEKKLKRYPISDARFVATEACRRAANGAAFLKRVYNEIGLDIGIISSEEEAKLAFLGCSSLLNGNSRRAIVFDIGGGSTEMMWVDVESVGGHSISDWLSIGYGVMNLADKFGGSGFADMAFDDMVRLVGSHIDVFDRANAISETIGHSPVQLLSTSGTVTTLAAVHLGLPRYDRARIDGLSLPISHIRATIRRLLAMRPSERFHHPCIGPDRADFILSGCAIFEAISRLCPEASITIADRGVREGIILSLMREK